MRFASSVAPTRLLRVRRRPRPYYQRAIAARPDDWLTRNVLGSFYYARGRYAEAETAYRRVVALAPDNTRAHSNLGATLFALHRPEEAAAAWERSVAIRPTNAAVSNGTYYFERGRYTEAARAFEQAVKLMPNDHRVWRNLAAALYWAPGERDKAAAAYSKTIELAEKAREVNPRQADLLAQLADAYSMVKREREARDAIAALERLRPDEHRFSSRSRSPGSNSVIATKRWRGWKAIAAGYTRERIERSPSLSELRKDRRFGALMTR